MTVSVAYHAEYGCQLRPAINVKLHVAGLDLWPDAFLTAMPGTPTFPATRYHASERYGPLVEHAYESIASDFWQAASEQAVILGLGEIAQEGRSGGWLVFTDGRDPEDMTACERCRHDDDAHAVDDEDAALVRCSICDCPDEVREDRIAWLDAYARMVAWCERELAAIPARVARLAQDMAMDAAGEDAARRMFATFRRELTLREYRATGAESFYTGGM